MQVILIEVIAALAGGVAGIGLIAKWRQLTKIDKQTSVIVTREDTHKTVTLPQKYSPTAVRALAELVA